jgi:membrane protease YdiL (CAAX protease family)
MKRINWGVWDILLCYGGMVVLQMLILNGGRIVFPGLFAAVEAYGMAGVYLGAFLLQCTLLLVLIWALILRRRGHSWADLGFVLPQRGAFLRYGVAGGLALAALMMAASYVMLRFLPETGAQEIETALLQSISGWVQGCLILSACCLAPLYEEAFFRGVVYTWLRSHLSAAPACLAGGAAFALLHMDLWRFLPIAAGGAVLCYIFEKSQSIYAAVVAHALWNGVMVVAVVAVLHS